MSSVQNAPNWNIHAAPDLVQTWKKTSGLLQITQLWETWETERERNLREKWVYIIYLIYSIYSIYLVVFAYISVVFVLFNRLRHTHKTGNGIITMWPYILLSLSVVHWPLKRKDVIPFLWNYFILFHFILSYFILFYFISFF